MNSFYKEYLNLLGNIPEFLNKYLNIPTLNRLKNISYFCGMDYASKEIYDFKEKITRFDHSLTVALLVWKFTNDKNATLAGLLHDAGTPCFSHVIDYMNKDYLTQESTEKFTEDIIRRDKLLIECLRNDRISLENIINFKNYSIVDLNRPKLCADRLDGIILTGGLWTGDIDFSDVYEIINDLEVYKDEGILELGFKSLNTAKKVFLFSEEIDNYCHSNEDNYMMELLANITRKAISYGLIDYKDLYVLDEEELMNILKKCEYFDIMDLLYSFQYIEREDIPYTKLENVKKRYIDPLVMGKRLSKVK